MRIALTVIGFGAALAGPAAADTLARTCSRGEDVRVIEVLTPGEVGTACDLRYVRDRGANVSVPYHANQDADYCGERARALATSLIEAGYACTEGDVETREASLTVGDLVGTSAADETAPVPAETQARPVRLAEVPAPLTQPAPVAARESAQADAARTAPAQTATIQSATAQTEPAQTEPARSEPAHSEPAHSEPAMRGPVALAPTSVAAISESAWAPSTAGKFVGAIPDDAPLQLASVDAQEDRLEPAAGGPARQATAAASEAQTPVAAKPRAARDLIRAVLEAQVAAWNDGDLEAFMSYYWNSPNLRFVAGSSSVTEGWGPTMEHYRKAYGEGAALGQLACEYTHLQMLTPDVAVVVGKFELTRGERLDTGGFTLVVQRFDGVWRVVHDHSVMDPPPATE